MEERVTHVGTRAVRPGEEVAEESCGGGGGRGAVHGRRLEEEEDRGVGWGLGFRYPVCWLTE
jgi:hypothetical protein